MRFYRQNQISTLVRRHKQFQVGDLIALYENPADRKKHIGRRLPQAPPLVAYIPSSHPHSAAFSHCWSCQWRVCHWWTWWRWCSRHQIKFPTGVCAHIGNPQSPPTTTSRYATARVGERPSYNCPIPNIFVKFAKYICIYLQWSAIPNRPPPADIPQGQGWEKTGTLRYLPNIFAKFCEYICIYLQGSGIPKANCG